MHKSNTLNVKCLKPNELDEMFNFRFNVEMHKIIIIPDKDLESTNLTQTIKV